MASEIDSLPAEQRRRLKKAHQPVFVAPMKATLTGTYFDDPGWIYERKLDGVRCVVVSAGGEVKLFSRNHKRKNSTYPEIVDAVGSWSRDFAVDGELVTFNGAATNFSRMQQRIHVKKPDADLLKNVPVFFYVFDVLFLDGHDLRGLPLRARKQVLKKAFSFADPVRYLPHRNEKGRAYLDQACSRQWEGIVAKDASSEYQSKRSRRWLKFKCSQGQELVIAGYTPPQASRLGFGALLVGYYEDNKLRYAGRVGTGFSDATLRSLHRRLAQLKRKTCPFEDDSAENGNDITWVSPKLVGEFGFTEWTADGKLRHPRFLGLRDDKDAAEVVREAP